MSAYGEPDSILHEAAYEGNFDRMKCFLQEHHHDRRRVINLKNRLGCSPLRLAATAGHVKCVTHLIYQGADIDMADCKAQTPLFVAVKNKHLDCVRALLEMGANPNGNIQSLCTPLYIAAMDGFLEGVRELVNHNAEIDRSQLGFGSFNSSPLYITVAYHHLDCFRALLCAGADPNFAHRALPDLRHIPSCQSLYHAVIRHNVEVEYAELLYDFGACLYYRDEKGRLASDMDQDNECKHYIKTLYTSPHTLLSCCRLAIRRALGRPNLLKINSLPLPSKMLAYLRHGSTSYSGHRTIGNDVLTAFPNKFTMKMLKTKYT